MKPIQTWMLALPLALVAALFFGLREPPRIVAAVPEAAEHDPDASPELSSIHDGTAIGVVIRANGNEVPKNGAELMRALAKVGDFAQLPVPFSAVALDSGLTHPRIVIAPRLGSGRGPAVEADPEEDPDPTIPAPKRPRPKGANASGLSSISATKPNLEGRLFLAANLEKGLNGEVRAKTIEFISWNGRKKKFDFGVIECSEKEPELRILDGVRCFSCHKNKGPILGSGPWSNSTNNDIMRATVQIALSGGKRAIPPKKGNPMLEEPGFPVGPGGLGGFGGADLTRRPPRVISGGACAGMSEVGSVGESEFVDSSVRVGSNMVRDREVYKAMSRTGDGRKVLVTLLTAIVDGQTDSTTQQFKQQIDFSYNITPSKFIDDFMAIHKSSSSTLVDFNPSGSTGVLKNVITNEPGAWGSGSTLRSDLRIEWSGSVEKILEYDEKRAAGEHGMPSHRLPSNPRAFIKPDVKVPVTPSVVVSPTILARSLGLTEGDRKYMSDALSETVSKINKPKVTTATLAKDVFNGPKFADALKTADLPDREDFKERFITALADAAKTHNVEAISASRKDYASVPIWALTSKEDREPAAVPTTNCLRCHDVQGAGKAAFNPIPTLAFDPFDKQARETWVKNADKAKKQAILGRLLKRLVTDKDMPPEDSAEYELFRQKDPASFDAVKQFLEAELEKAAK